MEPQEESEEEVTPQQVADVISQMPTDVLNLFAQYLPPADMAVLRSANRRMYAATSREATARRQDIEQWEAVLESIREGLAAHQVWDLDIDHLTALIALIETYRSYSPQDVNWDLYGPVVARLNQTVAQEINEALRWLREREESQLEPFPLPAELQARYANLFL